MVAKPDTELPELDVPVWIEPAEPVHPLCGLVAALEHGPVIAVACDQPWVTAELLRALAAHDGPALAVADEPFPGRYEPAQLPRPARGAARRSVAAGHARAARAARARRLDPALVRSVNTREDLAAAEVSADVAVIGGGIVGCALAAFLAEGGARVVLYEREAIAAGASGRNSGVVQDTLDPALDRPLRGVARALPHARPRLRAAGRARRAAAGRAISRSSPSPGRDVSRRRGAARGRAGARRRARRLPARDRPPGPARRRRARVRRPRARGRRADRDRRGAAPRRPRDRRRRAAPGRRRGDRRRPVERRAGRRAGLRRCGASSSSSSCPTRRGTCSRRPGSTC